MELLKSALLGLVEGITEWLPISSTGHMILLDEFLRLDCSDAFREMFFVVIQLGAILAVALLYFQKLNPFSRKKTPAQRKDTWVLWSKVLVGCLPVGILGLLLDDWFDAHFYNAWVVAGMLILYGILFLVIENRKPKVRVKSLSDLSYQTALFIGLFQILSLIPGTSRSGATILGGLLLGTSRFVAAEFTFFLAIPVMVGASGYKLLKFGFDFTPTELAILFTGLAVAFVVSLLAIRFLMGYIKKHDFKVFGWYRIALGALVLLYFGIIA